MALSLLLALGLAEVILRVFCRSAFPPLLDEKNVLFQYDANLGWFPIPNTNRFFTGSRTISVQNDSEGFRGPEFKSGALPVIIFLGDSFTWGYDVEAGERFTDKLLARHPEWAIYNLGVSGYGTDQELLLLKQKFDKYRPQTVFLLICDNDRWDNSSICLGGYYKPHFALDGNRLVLQNSPVPRGERAIFRSHPKICSSYLVKFVVRAYCRLFLPPQDEKRPTPTTVLLQALSDYVQGKGARLTVGFTGVFPGLAEFLNQKHIPWIDLSTTNVYHSWGWHWTPEGHDLACDKIEHLLTNQPTNLR